MEYIPEQRISEAFEYAESTKNKYHRFDKLLEKRIKKLLAQGKITVHENILEVINHRNANKNNYPNLSFIDIFVYRSTIINNLSGIEETINSTEDHFVKFLYKKCKQLGELTTDANNFAINQLINNQRRKDLEAWLKVKDIPLR
ncbi:MAG TPA: hypothetical protein P5277_00870 [Candidatus Paceibacterota bacterium]|nr:hypothetical protein [Candidatus Paceibacterota bacterium]